MPNSYIPPWLYRASNRQQSNLVSGEVLKHMLRGKGLGRSPPRRLSSLIFSILSLIMTLSLLVWPLWLSMTQWVHQIPWPR